MTRHRGGTLLGAHRHDAAYASIVLAGSYTELSSGVPGACPSGVAVMHGPHEEHVDYFHGDVHCLNVSLSGLELAAVPRVLPLALLGPLAAGLGRLAALVEEGGSRRVRERHAVAAEAAVVGKALRTLARRMVRHEHGEPRWLAAALASELWTTPTPLRQIAREQGVHPTHFSRAFHRHLGETPHAYRQRARVREASRLLLEDGEAAAAIALRCGFSDQSHFVNAFRTFAGMPPAAYRRAFAR